MQQLKQMKQKKLMPYFVKTLEQNLPAQKFYESMGFHVSGELLSRIGEHDYVEKIYTYE
jgi:predicted enzyme involved in methoxymalonyl-ACP biosynthesis